MAKSPGTTSNKLLYVLIVVVLALLAAAIVNFFFVTQRASHDEEFLGYISSQMVLSQSVANHSQLALQGNDEAFGQLFSDREQFDTGLDRMRRGNPATMMPEGPSTVQRELRTVQEDWNEVRDAVQLILDERDDILRAHEQLGNLESAVESVNAEIEELGDMMLEAGVSPTNVFYVGRLAQLAPQIQQWGSSLVEGVGEPRVAATQISDDNDMFARIIRGFYDGDDDLGISALGSEALRDQLREVDRYFGQVDNAVQSLHARRGDLVSLHEANQMISERSDALLSATRGVESSYQSAMDDRLFSATYGYIFGGAALFILGLLVYVYVLTADTRKAAALQLEQNERNQEAILRLLDELGSLADGDLTVQVSVTEDITGAIADSINYAVEALRDLVVTINDTAVRVDATAQQTRATTSHLAESSEHQSAEISSASRQIQEMAESIEQVSENAERSTKVAQQSVEIAHKGGDAVRRTIDGMNSIRETIQETSKRIKRLGESSQEIGDIVELINDIAEQTNILALNAAIQASAAGEQGRGFAVVADEVQRLAERSGNATRQIEALVKTIQTDTNEAVISMEESTSGVVSGAQLAENAGEALDEIEKVSNHIATLIQSISGAARQQAKAAADVSRTMQVIQEITSQTHEGTTATAENVGKLASLATELRKSVAGFKLPGKEQDRTVVMTSDAIEDASGGSGEGDLESFEDVWSETDESTGTGDQATAGDEGLEELGEVEGLPELGEQDRVDEEAFSEETVEEIEWPEEDSSDEETERERRQASERVE